MSLLAPTRPPVQDRERETGGLGTQPRGRRPRRGGSVLLLPPWTRAPWLSFGQPAVVLAVLGAAAILACASSSAALFLSSASSESLRVQLAAECDDAAFPVLQQQGRPFLSADESAADETVRPAIRAAGLSDPYRVFLATAAPVAVEGQNTLGRLLFRDGAIDQVEVLDRGEGEGVFLPQQMAERLDVAVGGEVTVAGFAVPVVGIYTDLWNQPDRSEYWCSYEGLFLNEASLDPPPPPLVLATEAGLVDGFEEAQLTAGFFAAEVFRSWVAPIEVEGLTLTRAREIVAQRETAFEGSGITNQFGRAGETGLLPTMVDRTTLLVDGLRGPVVPIAIGGSLLALLLVGAAGSYWADRRVREVRLLSSRGVGPVALAGKAALELIIPAAIGTALGWWLARWLVQSIGPSQYLDQGAPARAALTAGIGLLAGMLLLAAVAGLRARGSTEKTIGAKQSWPALVPWEVLLLAAAVVSWLRLEQQEGVVIDNNVAQVNLLLVSFPLLFLAGAAILLVRLLAAGLPVLRRRAPRWRPAPYLAVSRVASSRLISGALLATVAMPIGVLVYSATLTATTEYSLDVKAKVLVGSDNAIISVDPLAPTPEIDAVGTIVARYPYGILGDQDVTVLAIDPRTFERYVYWDDRFADESLASLVAALQADDGSEGVNAIAMDVPGDRVTIGLGQRDVEMDIVATADTLPGRRQPGPVLYVLASELGEIDRTAGTFTELWSPNSQEQMRAVLPEEFRQLRQQSTETVFRVANFLAVTWTFGYLQALAAFVGAVAIGGLLLYLETRQRTRVASYALARRMGLRKGSHLRSLILELGALLGLAAVVGGGLAWLAVLTAYDRLELDPTRPPAPLLTIPTLTLLAALVATVAVALLAAAYAQRAASRADMAEVLRLGS